MSINRPKDPPVGRVYHWSIDDVLFATGARKDHFDRMTRMVNDVTCDQRRDAQECPVCFYSQKIGGASMTESKCSMCGKELIFGNTNTDELCIGCATVHGLCKHCGGDIELKQRRKL